MVAQKKIFTVQNLTQKIKDARAFYLGNYRGLNVDQMTDLRKTVKKAQGELEVVKNRLFKLALKNSAIKIDPDKFELTGPTVILWANENEISPLKALIKFSRETGLPEMKTGFLDQEFLSTEKIKILAKIPSRKQLEAKLVGTISAPIYGLTRSLGWNLQRLTLVIKKIAESKNN